MKFSLTIALILATSSANALSACGCECDCSGAFCFAAKGKIPACNTFASYNGKDCSALEPSINEKGKPYGVRVSKCKGQVNASRRSLAMLDVGRKLASILPTAAAPKNRKLAAAPCLPHSHATTPCLSPIHAAAPKTNIDGGGEHGRALLAIKVPVSDHNLRSHAAPMGSDLPYLQPSRSLWTDPGDTCHFAFSCSRGYCCTKKDRSCLLNGAAGFHCPSTCQAC